LRADVDVDATVVAAAGVPCLSSRVASAKIDASADRPRSKGSSMVRVRTLAAAVAATLLPALALAQASAPLTREQVKAETRAAQKAGQLTPAGQGGARSSAPAQPSTLTTAERKAQTLEARKQGELQPAGVTQKADVADAKKKSTKTREQRKAETAEARKKGELVPAGEGPTSPPK
jgi:hypothetical protein